jgi:putative heme-binding domain-containing protein
VEDRWSALALLTSVGSRPWPVWKRLVEESPAWFGAPDGAEAWLVEKLAALAVRSRDETDLREALAFTEQDNQPIYARIVLLSTVAEAEKSEPFLRRLSARDLADGSKSTAKILAEAQRIALSREGPLPIRLAAIRLLGRRPHSSVESLASLLPPQNPPEIQSAAVTALVEMNNPGAAAVAFEGLERCTRSTRQQLITSAPRASALADALLAALEQGRMQLTEVDPSTRQALRRSADTELKQRAERLFRGAISSDRDQVVQSFKPAVEMTGERKHGAEIFAKICLQCHAMQGEGARVGPDLSGIATQSRETMVMNILDPSRQVLPDFVSYTATTADGETLTGLIVAESATGVTLRRPNVPDATVQRSQIKELKADGKSLMPDGLEQGLSVQDMADLLSFLRQPEAALLPKDK